MVIVPLKSKSYARCISSASQFYERIHRMESEFFQYLTANSSESAVDSTEDNSNTSVIEPEWVPVPSACREGLLHLYLNECGDLTDEKEDIQEAKIGKYVLENDLNSMSGEECNQGNDECTYLELKTVSVEASKILGGGVDGYTYVKTGQNCMESYRDEFGFYVYRDEFGFYVTDQYKDLDVELPKNSVSELEAKQCYSALYENGSEPQNRHSYSSEANVAPHEIGVNNTDSVSLMKLRLHRIISNSENDIRQFPSNSEEILSDSKIAARKPLNVKRVDSPVRKISCPVVSQIAATIVDRWKSMGPLGVTGPSDLPKNTSTTMKAEVISRLGSTTSVQHTGCESVTGKAVDDKKTKTSRALRALNRRRESQLALQQLRQMSKPVFKRKCRSDGGQSLAT